MPLKFREKWELTIQKCGWNLAEIKATKHSKGLPQKARRVEEPGGNLRLSKASQILVDKDVELDTEICRTRLAAKIQPFDNDLD